MTMLTLVLTLLLCCSCLVVQCLRTPEPDVPEPEGFGRRCYTCRRAGDNEECNQEIGQCFRGQFCHTDVSYKNNVMLVTKRCRRKCKTTNQSFCNAAGTKCWYCCDKDLCNQGLEYIKDSTDNSTKTDDECRGPRGPQGGFGPDGRPGPRGPVGQDGIDGLNGLPGHPGLKGEAGDRGMPGDRGPFGPTGVQGIDGLDGRPGKISERGPTGEPGLHGIDGYPGLQGPHGRPGFKGDRGDKGLTGECVCPNPAPEVPPPEVVVFYGRVSGVSQVSTDPVALVIETSVNLGHAYNTTSSVFTAPHRAAYLFSVNVICDGNKAVPLQLFKNEESVARSGRHEDNQIGTAAFYPVGIIQVILTLEVGDEVTLRVTPRGEGFWDRFKSFMASHSDVTYSGHMVGYA